MSEPDPDDDGGLDAAIRGLARLLARTLPRGYGFGLVLFEHNDTEFGSAAFMTNVPREDAIVVIKELLESMERDKFSRRSTQPLQ